MKKIIIVYGSTTGNTETLANLISDNITEDVKVCNVIDVDLEDIRDADLVLFGSSTWGYGDLQEDFNEFIENFSDDLLSGKDVAVFGCGDQDGFAEVFCEATETIKEKALECGANIVTENLKVTDDPSDSEDLIIQFVSEL